jgi:hypothetical protein
MVQGPLLPNLKEASNSRRKSERLPDCLSPGNKPSVFHAQRPSDLPGVHADLISKTLCHDEELLYLLSSSIVAGEKGLLGSCVTSGSHSVALTKHRFIISQDRHIEGIAPTVQSIPFRQVLYLELGSALFVGWFSIEFVGDGRPSSAKLFFPAATGMKYFGMALQKYRSINGPAYDLLPVQPMEWAEIWRRTPKTVVDHLKPLIPGEELPFIMLRCSEQWILRKRQRKGVPAYLSTNGVLVSTNFGLIHATEEPFTKPETFNFGINACCIAFDGLKSAQLLEKSMHGKTLRFLRLKIARGDVAIDFDIPFDPSSQTDAENLVHFLARGGCLHDFSKHII